MNASLIVILLMAVTVVIALGISMASFNSSKKWLFVAEDPRENNARLHFEIEASNYEDASNSANEVKNIYQSAGIGFDWIEIWQLDQMGNKVELLPNNQTEKQEA